MTRTSARDRIIDHTRAVIARRKGSRVRYFDQGNATMGPWVPAPGQLGPRRQARRDAVSYEAMRERMSRLPVIHNTASLESMTNARIREVGQRVLGLSFPSKARKADMVATYLAEQTERIS